MTDHADALADLDRAIAALHRARAKLVGATEAAVEGCDDDLIDTATASERFNLIPGTVRWLAYQKGFGIKRGGRWLIRATALAEYLKHENHE